MCSTKDDSSGGGKNSALSIAYISPGWPAHVFHNGIVTGIGTLAPALRARGHRVTILAQKVAEELTDESVYDLQQIGKPRSTVQNILRRVGYRLAPMRTDASLTRRSILTAIHRAQAERGIQIAEIEESFGVARSICQNASIPICVRLHGPWFLNGPAEGYPRDEVFRRRVLYEGQAIQAAYAVTAVSNDVLNRVREFYGLALSNAQVIHGTVPAVTIDDRWKLKDAEPKTVLFVGRFDRHKGADLIVEAFASVLQEIPDAQLWMVGPDSGLVANDGSRWKREDFIRDRLPGALEEGRIRSMGFQSSSELARLRRRAMVTVICSRYETFSSATLESLTVGCPTVAAKVGGIPEIIRDRETGFFHRSEDAIDLAAKIRILLTEPAHAAEMGRRAAEDCAQRFHPAVIADLFAGFFAQVVDRWNQGSRTA